MSMHGENKALDRIRLLFDSIMQKVVTRVVFDRPESGPWTSRACHLNLTDCGDTKSSMRRGGTLTSTSF
jgi:hypothetical protein